MEFHELTKIFPMMSAEEFAALKVDIATHGLREAIVVAEGKVVDGRNRYNACIELGIEPKYVQWDSVGSLVAFIVSMNLHRRHLNESQRALVAGRLANMRQGARTDLEPRANLHEVSVADAGSLLSVSERSVKSAKKVLNEGVPELEAAVDSGKVAVSLAAKVTDWDDDDQLDFIDAIDEKKPSHAFKQIEQERKQRERGSGVAVLAPSILVGDFRETGNEIKPDSIDLIFTDPPYAETGLYKALAKLAQRVLRSGGLCLSYSGQIYLPEILALMSQHLEYIWVCGIRHTGGEMRIRKWHIRAGWKPILVFGKPPITVWWDWFSDMTSGGKDKRFHQWQQPEAEAAHYIQALCPPGGVVLDPMCGTGTTLVAAKDLKRQYMGIELDPDLAKQASSRL